MLLIIRGYRRWVSPALPPSCRFLPSCSEYAQEALERHGAIRGGMLAARRLLACQPWGRSGFDPVPPCPAPVPGTGRVKPPGAMAGGSPGAAAAVAPHPEDTNSVSMTS